MHFEEHRYNSEDTMSTNTEATFIRRKFTITEELDAELERMADNNYQGNVSLCLRQAITDHRETLHGNGDLTVRRLAESVAHIEDQVSDLTRSVNKSANQTCSTERGSSDIEGVSLYRDDAVSPREAQILAVLEETKTPLRVADIVERVEMQPIDVRRILGDFIDQGHVFATTDDTPRYHLASISCTSTDHSEDRGGVRR